MSHFCLDTQYDSVTNSSQSDNQHKDYSRLDIRQVWCKLPPQPSPFLVISTKWWNISGSPKPTNYEPYETYANHNHQLYPVLFPSGRENFMKTTFSILTWPDCEHSSEEQIPRDYWVILHCCRSCNKMLKSHSGNCCVFCSYGSFKCNGEQNSANASLSSPVSKPH